MKRSIDVLGALVGLFFLSPILLVLTLLIRRQMGAPVLFRQMRPGLHGHPFQMVKFRTMRDAHDARSNALPDSAGLNRLGRFLRV